MMAHKIEQIRKRQAFEAYLVASAMAGDRTALDRLARLVGPGLLSHARRLTGDADLARDVVQAAWVEILRSLHSLRDKAAFRALALRIVTRRVSRVIRKRQQDRILAADWAAEQDITTDPSPGAAAVHARLHKAISGLSADHRTTLSLFYLEDMTIAEVAQVLDLPQGTVKTRLMHARAKLRGVLEGD